MTIKLVNEPLTEAQLAEQDVIEHQAKLRESTLGGLDDAKPTAPPLNQREAPSVGGGAGTPEPITHTVPGLTTG